MAILLGIDTGGTYTDAVLHDEDAAPPGVPSGIIAKAKALTTHHDLSIGIAGAIDAVLARGPGAPVSLVALSTTLATNALVEGRGGRICLILIGFDQTALARAGLAQTLGRDPVVFAAGGHDPTGARQAPLDRAAVAAAVAAHAPAVDAFAVVAWFGTRNPEDEIAAGEIVRQTSGLPVTCGHDLSAALNAPRRAVTAALNARLTGMIAELISATQAILAERKIRAPLMLVRGDGSLVAAAFARARPIETILSGPAASLVGAAHLTGLPEAVVADIGGTTTDIGLLGGARPALGPEGARVGGHQTMVEAVDMATHGLGGDSEVAIDERSLDPRLILGPRRLVPISLLAAEHPQIVQATLGRQLQATAPGAQDARFLLAGAAGRLAELRPAELALLATLGPAPVPADTALASRAHETALGRLLARGLARVAGFTPSDAAHVLGRQAGWDRDAARQAATLMARKRDAAGRPVAPTPEAFADLVHRTLVRRSAELILEACLARDGLPADAGAPLARAALEGPGGGHRGVARVDVGLALPLIGLGAAAPLYYPDIAALLGTRAVVPPDADVANAVGAVVGRVRITRAATVTEPGPGIFRAHLPGGTRDYPSAGLARRGTLAALADLARAEARAAGAAEVELAEDWAETAATVEGQPVFVEAVARVTASGRPRLG